MSVWFCVANLTLINSCKVFVCSVTCFCIIDKSKLLYAGLSLVNWVKTKYNDLAKNYDKFT